MSWRMRARHRLREPETAVDRASDEEIVALLGGCCSARDRLIVLLMARAGLRRGELCGLRRSDVHLLLDSRPLGCETGRAHLHVARQDNPNGAWAKSRRQRTVPLDFLVVQAFDARLTAFAYISALLAERGDRKSCWQLAEQAGHVTPRRMQALLAEHAWDWKAALAALQRFVLAYLGDPEAIVVLDETAELKKGTKTVGVARQHAGITGQVENCQTVVFLAYVTARAHALFDFRLYLPKAWCADRERRERARIPDDVPFTTKPALGTAMVAGAAGAGVPFAWVAGDEVYGRSSKLREACERTGKGTCSRSR